MSIGAAIDKALPFLQAQARSMQTQTVHIVRADPLQQGTPDPVSGVVTPVLNTIYDGPGRVKPLKRVSAGDVRAGEETPSTSIFIVSLPHTALGVKPGDTVHVTSTSDPELLIDTLRVVIIEDGEQTTARRLTCELVEARTS